MSSSLDARARGGDLRVPVLPPVRVHVELLHVGGDEAALGPGAAPRPRHLLVDHGDGHPLGVPTDGEAEQTDLRKRFEQKMTHF